MPPASRSARSRSRVDASVLWVGAGLAMAAAVLLAYVPRLPSPHAPAGLGLATGSVRITPGTNRRLRVFATTQIAFSFVLLAGAGMLLATLVALQTANTGYDMRHVLVFDIPTSATGAGVGDAKAIDFYQEATRRIGQAAGRGRRRASAASCRGAMPAASVPVVPVHRRGLHAGERRREPARAVPHRRASLLRRARRPDPRRPRLHRRRPRRQRTGGDRQPERRAAAVPERRRGEPAHVVDRSVLRQQATAAPHRRRRGRRGRRERGAADRR